jgi:cytochrome c5
MTTQLPMQTNTQPVLPTYTQPPLITDTLPPLPTDTQPPVSTDTQLPSPTITQPQSTSTEAQPAISGATLLDTRCTVCHSKVKVTGKHKSQSEWNQTVQRMVLKGAFLTPEELIILVDYLAENY